MSIYRELRRLGYFYRRGHAFLLLTGLDSADSFFEDNLRKIVVIGGQSGRCLSNSWRSLSAYALVIELERVP